MDKNEIAELQNLPEAELVEAIGALSGEELTELRTAEAAAKEPRKAVLDAVDAALAALANQPPSADKANAGAAKSDKPAKAKADETPAWQKPDYSGPLTIEQMQWRNHNVKPVVAAKVRTK